MPHRQADHSALVRHLTGAHDVEAVGHVDERVAGVIEIGMLPQLAACSQCLLSPAGVRSPGASSSCRYMAMLQRNAVLPRARQRPENAFVSNHIMPAFARRSDVVRFA